MRRWTGLAVKLNGDFHEFEFRGMAQDVVDSASFQVGDGGGASFSNGTERFQESTAIRPIPGNLGQVWLGVITEISSGRCHPRLLNFENISSLRAKEFGSTLPSRSRSPGPEKCSLPYELFSQDDHSDPRHYTRRPGSGLL